MKPICSKIYILIRILMTMNTLNVGHIEWLQMVTTKAFEIMYKKLEWKYIHVVSVVTADNLAQ